MLRPEGGIENAFVLESFSFRNLLDIQVLISARQDMMHETLEKTDFQRTFNVWLPCSSGKQSYAYAWFGEEGPCKWWKRGDPEWTRGGPHMKEGHMSRPHQASQRKNLPDRYEMNQMKFVTLSQYYVQHWSQMKTFRKYGRSSWRKLVAWKHLSKIFNKNGSLKMGLKLSKNTGI